jgi:hypothetical protein
MEQTRIELSRLKLLGDKNEVKNLELEVKIIIITQEVISLQHHIMATKVQIKKILHAKEKELNKL